MWNQNRCSVPKQCCTSHSNSPSLAADCAKSWTTNLIVLLTSDASTTARARSHSSSRATTHSSRLLLLRLRALVFVLLQERFHSRRIRRNRLIPNVVLEVPDRGSL